jgi:hypothetical protein
MKKEGFIFGMIENIKDIMLDAIGVRKKMSEAAKQHWARIKC